MMVKALSPFDLNLDLGADRSLRISGDVEDDMELKHLRCRLEPGHVGL